jgi:hypothetical protein
MMKWRDEVKAGKAKKEMLPDEDRKAYIKRLNEGWQGDME